MNEKAKKVLKYSLSLVLAAVLVYFALHSLEWDKFVSGFMTTRWAWVAIALLAALLALVFRMERWRLLLLSLDPGAKRLDIWDADNIGNLANIAIPGAGEFIRCAYASNRKLSYDKTLGTIVLERAFDALAVVVLLVLSLIMKWNEFSSFFYENILGPAKSRLSMSLGLVLLLAFVFGAIALFCIFRFRGKVKLFARIASWIKGLLQGFTAFAKMPQKTAFLLNTVGIWAMYIMVSWTCIKAIPALSGIGIADAIFISAIGNFASIIPVPGGIGAYHYIIALTLSTLYASSWENGILFATLGHETHAMLIIVLGIVSYVRITLSRRKV